MPVNIPVSHLNSQSPTFSYLIAPNLHTFSLDASFMLSTTRYKMVPFIAMPKQWTIFVARKLLICSEISPGKPLFISSRSEVSMNCRMHCGCSAENNPPTRSLNICYESELPHWPVSPTSIRIRSHSANALILGHCRSAKEMTRLCSSTKSKQGPVWNSGLATH